MGNRHGSMGVAINYGIYRTRTGACGKWLRHFFACCKKSKGRTCYG
ncbi:hypothetical protein [Coprococcus eutactus]